MDGLCLRLCRFGVWPVCEEPDRVAGAPASSKHGGCGGGTWGLHAAKEQLLSDSSLLPNLRMAVTLRRAAWSHKDNEMACAI